MNLRLPTTQPYRFLVAAKNDLCVFNLGRLMRKYPPQALQDRKTWVTWMVDNTFVWSGLMEFHDFNTQRVTLFQYPMRARAAL